MKMKGPLKGGVWLGALVLISGLFAVSASENNTTEDGSASSANANNKTVPITELSVSASGPEPIFVAASSPTVQITTPTTITDFIRSMMKKYGESKAVEAFQSLDQLPLGLIMKVLLVEMDQTLAEDIVQMQRYAQSSDKALIQMIGRIVAGDKNVPKDIFLMDQKLMKFPWWVRMRERMLNNLEKYVAAYSLVPVAAKTALSGVSKSGKGLETPVALPKSDLASAATSSANKPVQVAVAQVTNTSTTTPTPTTSTAAPDAAPQVQDPVASASTILASSSSSPSQPEADEASKLSLLNPIQQQQQILEALALAKAAQQAQQLLQLQQQLQFQQQPQQPQQSSSFNFNPLSFLLGG